MEKWRLTSDTFDIVRKVAREWPSGVVILEPLGGDPVVLAVTRVDMYNPSDNFHHTIIEGKDITLMVVQKFSVSVSGPSPIPTQINNITEVQIWELPGSEKFVWFKVREG